MRTEKPVEVPSPARGSAPRGRKPTSELPCRRAAVPRTPRDSQDLVRSLACAACCSKLLHMLQAGEDASCCCSWCCCNCCCHCKCCGRACCLSSCSFSCCTCRRQLSLCWSIGVPSLSSCLKRVLTLSKCSLLSQGTLSLNHRWTSSICFMSRTSACHVLLRFFAVRKCGWPVVGTGPSRSSPPHHVPSQHLISLIFTRDGFLLTFPFPPRFPFPPSAHTEGLSTSLSCSASSSHCPHSLNTSSCVYRALLSSSYPSSVFTDHPSFPLSRQVLSVNGVAEDVGELGLITCVWGGLGQATRLPPASGCAWAVASTSCNGCDRR